MTNLSTPRDGYLDLQRHDNVSTHVHVGFEPSPLDPMTLMATLGRRAEAAQLSIREAQAVVTHVHVDHVGLKSCRRVS